MNNALNILRRANVWVSTDKAALMCGCGVRWVQQNKNRFVFERKNNKRNLVFELSSVLKVSQELETIKEEKLKNVG